MNERIKELAKQAGYRYYPSSNSGPLRVEYLTPELEKFAELIILECANITLDYKNHDHYMGWVDHGEEIARHFGVER
jgi:hypothetical protein